MREEPTVLRVYASLQRLKFDFNAIAKKVREEFDCKIIPYREIYVPNIKRIIFSLDDMRKVIGYRPNKVFFDELVNQEIKDYLNIISEESPELLPERGGDE